MEIKKLQEKSSQRRTVNVNIRIYPKYSIWLREHKIRPSDVFNETVKELIEKEKATEEIN